MKYEEFFGRPRPDSSVLPIDIDSLPMHPLCPPGIRSGPYFGLVKKFEGFVDGAIAKGVGEVDCVFLNKYFRQDIYVRDVDNDGEL